MTTELTFRELVENSGDIYVVVDRDYKIRYISSTIERATGAKPITLLGQNIFDFVDQDRSEGWKRYLNESNNSASYEIGLELRKGTMSYFDVFVSNVSQGVESGSISLRLHDVTSRKTRELQLLESNKQLDQVIYKTTHDLKAPLTSALGLINLAEQAPADEKDEYIALIRKSLLRLSGFIEEMNHFFRSDKLALMRERIDMKSIIEEELENLKNLYQVGTLRIDVVMDEKSEFYSDLVRVKTVLTNILTNAIKYADGKKANPWVDIRVKTDAESCWIRIEDNGIGIDEKHQSKIFDLFYRATSQSSGTGIGLFIVKDTIDRLKGSIAVESKADIGTTFMIQIPNQVNQLPV